MVDFGKGRRIKYTIVFIYVIVNVRVEDIDYSVRYQHMLHLLNK